MMELKNIIQAMVREEVREILTENRTAIQEIVRTVFFPELKSAVQEEIARILNVSPENGKACVSTPPLSRGEIASLNAQEAPKTLVHGIKSHESSEADNPIVDHQGLYLYGVVEGGGPAVSLGAIGIEGNEVTTLPYKDMGAVVHRCKAEPYQSGDDAEVKDWVRAHQGVLDQVSEKYGSLLPMGFNTIVQGAETQTPEETLADWLEKNYRHLKDKMEKIRDRSEYGVQIFWDARQIARKIVEDSDDIKALQADIALKPKGTAYMYKHRLEKMIKEEMETRADQFFKRYYEQIKCVAKDHRIEKIKKSDDDSRQMLMNLSCLLSGEESRSMGETLEKLDAEEGISVRYTGPWSPYSFV